MKLSLIPRMAGLILSLAVAFSSLPAHADQRAKQILSNIDQATWFSEGHSQHIMYVFFDPNCPYCHRLFEELRPFVKENKLQVRWIPVGILTASSLGKAAAILQAKHPIQALYQSEADWNFGNTPGGGIEPIKNPSPSIVEKLRKNAALLESVGIRGIPVAVFKGDDGNDYLFVGAPSADKLAAIINHIQ